MYRSNIYWELRRRYWAKVITREVSPIVLVGLGCWMAWVWLNVISIVDLMSRPIIVLN